MTLFYNRLLDAIHNVADIIICNIWTCRQTEAYLEEVLFHTVGVYRCAVINRLLNESGIFVGELIPSSRGLEDYFIERMGN